MALKVTTDPNDLRSSLNREFSVVRLQRRTSMTRFERRASIENSNKRVHNMKVDDGMNCMNTRFANLIDDSGDKMMRRSFLQHSKSFRGITLNASEMKEDIDDDDDEFEQEVFKPRRESLLCAKTRQSLVLPTDMSKDIAMLLELVVEADEKEDAHDMDSSSLDNSSSDNDDTKYDKSRSTTTTTTTGRRNSTISFTKVIIKEYPYTLGDNPGGGQGVPLTIEWEPMTTEVIDFDEYELLREKDRRVLHQLKIPKKDRVDILLNAGYTQTQITKAINYVKNLRNQRLQTKQTLYNMVRDERNEKVKKKVKNFFTGYKKKERKYIEHSLSFTFMYIKNDDTSKLSSSCPF